MRGSDSGRGVAGVGVTVLAAAAAVVGGGAGVAGVLALAARGAARVAAMLRAGAVGGTGGAGAQAVDGEALGLQRRPQLRELLLEQLACRRGFGLEVRGDAAAAHVQLHADGAEGFGRQAERDRPAALRDGGVESSR